MAIKNKETCYLDLLSKIDSLDMQIKRIKNQLTELKSMICKEHGDSDMSNPEPHAKLAELPK